VLQEHERAILSMFKASGTIQSVLLDIWRHLDLKALAWNADGALLAIAFDIYMDNCPLSKQYF
jgi:hypothetical protein